MQGVLLIGSASSEVVREVLATSAQPDQLAGILVLLALASSASSGRRWQKAS